MLTDRYGLSIGTQSASARDAYAEGVDLLMAACPGGAAALDRALAQDPSFVLAHLGKARSMHLAGNLPAMRASFEQAQALAVRCPSANAARPKSFGASSRDRLPMPWQPFVLIWQRGRAMPWCSA